MPGARPANPYVGAGVALLVGGPLLGLVSYALVAMIVGESLLEDEGGLTALGVAAMAIPGLVGLALLLFGRRVATVVTPGGRAVSAFVAGVGALCLVVGLIGSVAGNARGDANIGAALLVPAGAVLLAVGGVGVVRSRTAPGGAPPVAGDPPPPPTGGA